MKKTNLIFIRLAGACAGLALLLTGMAFPCFAAEPPARVAIIPFTVNAEKDLTFLQNGIVDMLTSRLSQAGKVSVISRQELQAAFEPAGGALIESRARDIAAALGADYVLFGSLTVFGNSVSIDAKMTDVAGTRPTLSFFNQSQGMDEVIPRINLFAEEINEKTFGRKTATRTLPQKAPPPQSPSIYTHPERQLAGELKTGGLVKNDPSPFVMSRGAGGAAGFWKSHGFPMQLIGAALGDVDGDGKIETVLISDQKLLVYRAEGGRFVKISQFAGGGTQDFIAVDAADINKDGRAEIFVTALDIASENLDSFVLELQAGRLAAVSTGLNWYFRVLANPQRGAQLMGQKRGVNETFRTGIFELEWNGSAYEAMESIGLRKADTVFGFARGDFTSKDREMVVMLDKSDRLRLLSPSGREEWKSKDRFGGSEIFLEVKKASIDYSKEDQLGDDPDRRYLPQRILVTDLDQDGKSEVLVVKNDASTGRFLGRYRKYSEGSFESLSWDGVGFSSNWRTRKISGYLCDYALGDFDNDGRPDLVGVLVDKRQSVMAKGRSYVIAYALGQLTGAALPEAPAREKPDKFKQNP